MKSLLLTLILLINSVLVLGQLLDDLSLNVGYNLNTYEVFRKPEFSNNSIAEDQSRFLNIYGIKRINKRFSYDFGIGINNEKTILNPSVKVGEISRFANQNFDTLIVSEVKNWDLQLQLPLNISFKLYDQIDVLPPLLIFPGMRVVAGLNNRITIDRLNTDNKIQIKNERGYGEEYYNDKLNKDISNYYSENIRYYKLLLNLGFEMFYDFQDVGFLAGVKYSSYLLSPLNSKITNDFSITAYMGFYYKIKNP